MPPVTRLAPSPTGALHLGNARTFLVNWLLARQQGWRIVLRIEDLDSPRVKPGAEASVLEDLRWLGLDFDEGPIRQSDRLDRYRAAVDRLLAEGRAYPCVCTRRDVERAASAPHAEDGATIYPGTCRDRFESVAAAERFAGRGVAIRFRVDSEPIEFLDAFAGFQRFDPERQLGDFVIGRSDGSAAYQMAVVVDDAESNVTEVIRGDDLLSSTPRQILVYRALGKPQQIPRYTHLPLVVGADGRRLAKRHGDSRVESYRRCGVPSERVLALLARWCGIDTGDSVTAQGLLNRFNLTHLPRNPILFTPECDKFLREGAG
ncbi:MAG: tRNA glutamyl-Q(34) synthetase GluQRS [Phycisphaerae bacterium]|nr:tRNA glutamyl-Q(34) synthetase GluQRS [Phycisphaerae bacterium]MDW8261571.1 tRNA glutamyl-Q(34) synthetase GluQRS [Phycisphaerales bacterium]